MRPVSKLKICAFRSDKKIDRLMQSDVAKSDEHKSDLRIRRIGLSDSQIEQ